MKEMKLNKVKNIHLVGIGGIGVSGVARLLLQKGYKITGSDLRESSITAELKNEGAKITIGHSPGNLKNAELVIYSSAIPKSNIEFIAAKDRGIPIMHRSEVLGELMSQKTSIGVTGTHGKGTVTAMIAWVLNIAGLNPSFYIGGILNNFRTNARYGNGSFFAAEIDESDGSLLNIQPQYVVINNVEADHLNYYKDFEDVMFTITKYINKNPKKMMVFINYDDAGSRMLIERIEQSPVTFGFSPNAEYHAENIFLEGLHSVFTVRRQSKTLGDFELNLPGKYNVSNALAAIAVCDRTGISPQVISEAVSSFEGIENRFNLVECGHYKFVKDYISHPTGIKKVLEAAKDFATGRVIAVFKPYRFTMINYLQNEYAMAFKDANLTVITQMWDAGEPPIEGINTEFLVKKIRTAGSRVKYIKDMENIPEFIEKTMCEGDIAIFFGGDDMFAVVDKLIERYRKL